MDAVSDALERIHAAINQCDRCTHMLDKVAKPAPMNRGDPGPVFVLGQAPGRTEIGSGRAFAGQAGKTLDTWLVKCGADPTNPRRGIYLTAVVKCVPRHSSQIRRMAQFCSHFLFEQLETVQPRLVITLGEVAYGVLLPEKANYAAALCTPVKLKTSTEVLFGRLGFDCSVLPWPHPSGLNRWLNAATNKERLAQSFAFVGQFLGGNDQ